jgi:hypothetical protein
MELMDNLITDQILKDFKGKSKASLLMALG